MSVRRTSLPQSASPGARVTTRAQADVERRSLAPSASPPSVGSSTTASVPARSPPEPFFEEAGAADGSSDFSPAADVDVVSAAVVAVSAGAVVVGAASEGGNVVLVAAGAGAAVVDETESAPLAAVEAGSGAAPARTTTVPFIQGWGAQ
jgi:hypothetical protein